MKKLSRLPWQHGAVLTIVWAHLPAYKVGSEWFHNEAFSYHLAHFHLGNLLILRLRQTDNHARRLGLPIL